MPLSKCVDISESSDSAPLPPAHLSPPPVMTSRAKLFALLQLSISCSMVRWTCCLPTSLATSLFPPLGEGLYMVVHTITGKNAYSSTFSCMCTFTLSVSVCVCMLLSVSFFCPPRWSLGLAAKLSLLVRQNRHFVVGVEEWYPCPIMLCISLRCATA